MGQFNIGRLGGDTCKYHNITKITKIAKIAKITKIAKTTKIAMVTKIDKNAKIRNESFTLVWMQNNMFLDWICTINHSRYIINLASQCALSVKLFQTAPPTVDVYRTDVCVCCCRTTFL